MTAPITLFATGIRESLGGIASANRNLCAALEQVARETGRELRVHVLNEKDGRGADYRAFGGDKIRFAIESSKPGYLYVFDRETYTDGTFGPPQMIFPESSRDHNWVAPGILVDIPDQREDVPYFNISPQKGNYTGELLTVIVADKPLTQLKLDRKGYVVNIAVLSELESDTEVETFSRPVDTDKIYSKTEANSACGVKARQLEREKPKDKPCGETLTQLTRDGSLPQSIFQVKTAPGQPKVAFITLAAQ